jgi:molecular chaperone GrpE
MAEETMVQGAEEKELALETEEAQDGGAQAGAQTVDAGGDGAEATAALKTELDQVRGERDQLLDRLARLQAEFENSRRRETKERQDVRDYAVQNAVEPFLGVKDNFELALKAEGSVEQLRAGVELILKQMDEALKALNVQPVESVGTQFDPRVHEALASIETAELPDHQVVEEIRKGYKLRDKLLRPALVKIAVNSKQVNE